MTAMPKPVKAMPAPALSWVLYVRDRNDEIVAKPTICSNSALPNGQMRERIGPTGVGFCPVIATPPGTTATVSVLPGQDEVAVTVTDDGPGVRPDELPRLFDRFYRADESRSRENGGSGLGLSIVAAIVRSHGGRILASHAPNGGLTMTVVLPRPVGTAAITGLGAGASIGVATGPIDSVAVAAGRELTSVQRAEIIAGSIVAPSPGNPVNKTET